MNAIENIINRRLFALLRLALWREPQEPTLFEGMDDEAWNAVYKKSVEQGVLAFAFDGVKMLDAELQPSIDVKIQWGYNVENIEKLYKHKVSVATRLAKLYADNGIRTMIMKGLSIARYYPVASHRQFGDIDIFLMGDYEQGNKIIAEMGAKIKYSFFVHSEFTASGVNIENHRWFVNPYVNRCATYVQHALEQLVDGVRPHPTVEQAYAPSAEFDALFLTRHSSWHYARESIHLRELCDWAVFLHNEHDNMNRALAERILRESGLERYASILTDICCKYLGLATDKRLALASADSTLVERVMNDILSYDEMEQAKRGVLATFYHKITKRWARKWCYDEVVPDSFFGNIFYSAKNYLLHPAAIFKAKS